MAVTLNVRMEGVETVVKRLETLAEHASDLTSAWPAVGRWYGQRSRYRFTKGNATWAPLKASYMQRKARRGYLGRGIGVATGSLREHATEDTPDVSSKQWALFGVTRADPASVVKRAGYLKKGRKTMKARNVVPALTATERRQIAEIIHDEIVKE